MIITADFIFLEKKKKRLLAAVDAGISLKNVIKTKKSDICILVKAEYYKETERDPLH